MTGAEVAARAGMIQCAYQECGVAYNTAVNVTLFTWKSFYVRSAALLAAAGYICFENQRFYLVAVLLLAIGALATWMLTLKQMINNQRVIRKVIAAGLYLEIHNPDLGCRYKLDALGDKVDRDEHGNILMSLDLEKLWTRLPGRAEDGRQEETSSAFNELGITPKTTRLCQVYIGLFAFLAIIVLVCGVHGVFGC